MKKVSMLIVAVLCICAVLGAATTAFSGEKDVVVVNTSSNPVPVNVVNTPVPVTMGAKEPFAAKTYCDAANFGSCGVDLYTVPEGKRLVVEYFSCNGGIPVGAVLTCRVAVMGEAYAYLQSSNPAPSGGFPIAIMSAGQQVRLYAAAGQVINVGVTVGGPMLNDPPNIQLSVIGYLEAAP